MDLISLNCSIRKSAKNTAVLCKLYMLRLHLIVILHFKCAKWSQNAKINPPDVMWIVVTLVAMVKTWIWTNQHTRPWPGLCLPVLWIAEQVEEKLNGSQIIRNVFVNLYAVCKWAYPCLKPLPFSMSQKIRSVLPASLLTEVGKDSNKPNVFQHATLSRLCLLLSW